MTESFETFEQVMHHAATLAVRGEGRVEPNPAVGAVVVDEELRVLGEGWHTAFGEAPLSGVFFPGFSGSTPWLWANSN